MNFGKGEGGSFYSHFGHFMTMIEIGSLVITRFYSQDNVGLLLDSTIDNKLSNSLMDTAEMMGP